MPAESPSPPPLSTPRTTPDTRPAERRIDSATLLGSGRELLIEHRQQVYRLRLTAQGKLILTK